MASKNLSQLPAASTSSGSDLYYVVQNGIDMSITFDNLLAAMGGGGGGANVTLSNLTTTSINADLVPASSQVLGSGSKPWSALWVNEILAPGNIDFNLVNGKIFNNTGSNVADFNNGMLGDNSGQDSIAWVLRRLLASNSSLSVDYDARALSDGVVGAQLTWTAAGIGLPQMAVSTVPYINGSNILTSSSVTPTELGYVSGVNSPIQSQLGFITAAGIIRQSGTAILSSGAVTVSSSVVDSSSLIFLTTQSMSGTIGVQYVANIVPGVSFDILSNSGADNSTVAYMLLEP